MWRSRAKCFLQFRGTLLGSLPNENYGELAAMGADAVGFVTYNQDYSARIFKQIDPAAKACGKEITLDVSAVRIFLA